MLYSLLLLLRSLLARQLVSPAQLLAHKDQQLHSHKDQLHQQRCVTDLSVSTTPALHLAVTITHSALSPDTAQVPVNSPSYYAYRSIYRLRQGCGSGA